MKGSAIAVLDWINKPIDQSRLIAAVKQAAQHSLGDRPSILHVEDDPDTHERHCDIPVVGPIDALPHLIDDLHIEHVFIALPMNRYADARRVFDALSQTTVDVQLVADVPAVAGMTFEGAATSSRRHVYNMPVSNFAASLIIE